MGHATCQNLELALAAVSEENLQKAQKVYEREKDINSMEKILTEFLVEVDNLSLTEGQQEQVKNLFYTVSDIERRAIMRKISQSWRKRYRKIPAVFPKREKRIWN